MRNRVIGMMVCVAVLFSAVAYAEKGDFYGGIGYGQNTLDGGVRVFGGYTAFDGFKVGDMPLEIGGEVTYLDVGTDNITPYNTVEERTVNITVVGAIEVLPKLQVFARAGVGQAEGKLTTTSFVTVSQTNTGLVPALGIGARYELIDHFGVRVDLEQYTGMYENATGLSASVYGRF